MIDLNWIPFLFAVNFSLLLLHEMDAIRAKEWKMFAILKDMKEQTGYIVFTLLHLPLYIWVVFSISQIWSGHYAFVYLATDIFLITHAILHFFFRRNNANEFSPIYSNILIYSMALLAIWHLVLII